MCGFVVGGVPRRLCVVGWSCRGVGHTEELLVGLVVVCRKVVGLVLSFLLKGSCLGDRVVDGFLLGSVVHSGLCLPSFGHRQSSPQSGSSQPRCRHPRCQPPVPDPYCVWLFGVVAVLCVWWGYGECCGLVLLCHVGWFDPS